MDIGIKCEHIKKNVYSQKVKAGNLEADTRALLQICFTEAE